MKRTWASWTTIGLLASTLVAAAPGTVGAVTVPGAPQCKLLPADNVWNTPVSALPVDPRSSQTRGRRLYNFLSGIRIKSYTGAAMVRPAAMVDLPAAEGPQRPAGPGAAEAGGAGGRRGPREGGAPSLRRDRRRFLQPPQQLRPIWRAQACARVPTGLRAVGPVCPRSYVV